jgi:hypothetical protein
MSGTSHLRTFQETRPSGICRACQVKGAIWQHLAQLLTTPYSISFKIATLRRNIALYGEHN